MRFSETRLHGAFIVELEPIEDERGFFARSWCEDEFETQGLASRLSQCNLSFNRRKGTVRGMHYQTAPFSEAKLVRCFRGSIHDIIIDLRPDSPTWLEWTAVELSARNRHALFIPEGFAHGFQSLEDDTEVFYQISQPFHSPSARGIRWNDSAFALTWPLPVTCISPKDLSFPNFSPEDFRHV